MPRRVVSLSLAGLLAVALVSAQPPTSTTAPVVPAALPPALTTLRPAHPRLHVLDEDLPRIRALIAADARVRGWRDRLQQHAARMLDEPVVERVLVGPRLLAQSRAALRRITT